MSEVDPKLIGAYQFLSRRVDRRSSTNAEVVSFAGTATRAGQAHLAMHLLERIATPTCADAAVWQALGIAYRDEQAMEAACGALGKARALDTANATTAFAYAQVLFETARPAGAAFALANSLAPNNPTLIRNHAGALAAEGQQQQGEALLMDILAREPEWLDGHKTLAALRVAAGDKDRFDDSFSSAANARTKSLSLRLAWLHLLSTARNWERARQVLHLALADFGPQKGLEMVRVHIASESGDRTGNDPSLFDTLKDVSDPGLDICRLRQALRLGDPLRAATIGEAYLNGPLASLFWPYLSLAWRLMGDARATWLDGKSVPVGQFDLGLSPSDLAELTKCLRGLHTARAPFLEQSVHGGTQTSGQLFFCPIPIIQKVREQIAIAVQGYVDQLGAADADHPLLGPPRDNPVLFEGSWSVLLKGGGHHSTHTHPKGWISSALYVDVPPADQIGTPPSGWISFGEGPPELGLDLQPYQQVKPEPGKLVLFPSTLWHRTMPFDAGERLTIAFDVKVPRPRFNP
jgi:tetratricopeptide (TPR) repeat protein